MSHVLLVWYKVWSLCWLWRIFVLCLTLLGTLNDMLKSVFLDFSVSLNIKNMLASVKICIINTIKIKDCVKYKFNFKFYNHYERKINLESIFNVFSLISNTKMSSSNNVVVNILEFFFSCWKQRFFFFLRSTVYFPFFLFPEKCHRFIFTLGIMVPIFNGKFSVNHNSFNFKRTDMQW